MRKLLYEIGKTLRHPRTTQEIRSQTDADEQGVTVRGKRSRCKLPTSWDDFFIPSPKSWKHKTKRKRQYAT